MNSLETMPVELAQTLRVLFTDIDDTLTTDGKLSGQAYNALWRLKDSGIAVVPVTGRPAGWCDLIARQWPVEGVIGENGALCYYETSGKLNRLYHPDADADRARKELGKIREAILRRVSGSRVSKDQFARLFDLAIDFCEEPPDLGWDAAEEIARIFKEMGATAKVSSIHVNGWLGTYDKLSMVDLFLKERWGWSLAEQQENLLFCGDSPNDEPMFEAFRHSCGVANVQEFKNSMTHLPALVTTGRGGEGFCELVQTILDLR